MPSKKIEEWLSIDGFSKYEASTLGNIRSVDRVVYQKVNGGKVVGIHRKGKVLKQKTYTGGYKSVYIINGMDVFVDIAVHRLVAIAFIPNPENKKCVHHINHIRSDNSLGNLQWVTHSENNKEAYVHGSQSRRGEKNTQSKLIDADVRDIKMNLEFGLLDIDELADKYNVSRQTICDIREERRWSWLTQ